MVIPDEINSCIPVADRDDAQHHISLAHLSSSGSVYVDKPLILHSPLCFLGPRKFMLLQEGPVGSVGS